ncbi:MAG TPA: 50S ribosomal protein L23 [Candidatus Latescibacteria bacterium]|nr:50S ribosomal protein L23 [Candidatus Latescibacterota bacterium]
MDLRRIIRRPVVTEKAMVLRDSENKYIFEVEKRANKIQIKKAVEAIFNVSVEEVRTVSVHGKPKRLGRFQGRRSDWKKAIVTLKEGSRIEFFEEV